MTIQLSPFRNQLAHLTYGIARSLLGARGDSLLREGGQIDVDVDEQVTLDDEAFRLDLGQAKVCITAGSSQRNLTLVCSCSARYCAHLGAALSLILEEKVLLGLAEPPPEPTVAESLTDEELIAGAIAERQVRATKEAMRIKAAVAGTPWTDYLVSNKTSGKTYRVALYGTEPGESYCSCPDFRKNTLGTCKHILHTLDKVRARFSAKRLGQSHEPQSLAVHLVYLACIEVRLIVPVHTEASVQRSLKPFSNKAIQDLRGLMRCIARLEAAGEQVIVYPDAAEYIEQQLIREHLARRVAEIRADPEVHPLRSRLLKAELLPYQLDGIAFAAGAGRAILADDMGLGKTIQGIGVAEFLARETGIERVLVITPASLKSQWQSEISRFSGRTSQLVIGNPAARAVQYGSSQFFTICNYEQVMRDLKNISLHPFDLVILDEGQRIKNWNTRTTNAIKSLKSRFALVLTGTPLENRLDDLYSVVEFVDDRHLGPAFRFYNHHRVVDEKGRVIGYKNLAALNRHLAPVLLRRTRASVQQQLPERQTEFVRITPTQAQLDLHASFAQVIRLILSKKFLTEMDLLRLQKNLLMCRLCANSTALVDKVHPGHSSKLDVLDTLIEQFAAEPDRKVILFSEWTGMLNLVEPLLNRRNLEFVRLDGSVQQKKRQSLVRRFQNDPDCRVFLTTNAGSTGLNLQAANTVVNVDLPWNPATLEQRIARAHRMGQRRQVQVYVLLTEDTIEERLIGNLAAKQQLAMAVLDPESEVDDVDLVSSIEDLKARLEVLLGTAPPQPVDVASRQNVERDLRREADLSRAGGRMVTAAFAFLNELLPRGEDNEAAKALTDQIEASLSQSLEPQSDGSLQLKITLEGNDQLRALAGTIARLVASQGQAE